MSVLIVFLGVGVLLLLVAVLRLNTFISFLIVSYGVALGLGMDPVPAAKSVQTGIGNILGSLVPILGLGAMLGKLVAESGGAQRITQTLIKWFGERWIQIALVLTGFVVGIPMFYSVGFVILVPLVFTVAASTRMPLLYVGMPMLASLSVAHGYLPPHPAPTAIAESFGADIGLTLIYGIVIAIPAILVGGIFFSRFLKGFNPQPPEELYRKEVMPEEQLPPFSLSMFLALLPAFLIAFKALGGLFLPAVGTGGAFSDGVHYILGMLGEPIIALLLSVVLAIWLLGLRNGRTMDGVMNELVDSVKAITMILLIIAGAGALKQVLSDSGVSNEIAAYLSDVNISPIILAWGIAAVIRICVGSATVAGLTTVGIIQGMIASSGIAPELLVLAIGAGSLMFSHVNDSGFWMFKEYFNLSLKDTFKTWSVMETLVSIMGLIGTLVLSWIL
ncbi:MAG: gluconate:H+ symporter [Bacteroidota bacterium]